MTKLKPQIYLIDVSTGEEILRDATAEEIAQMEIDKANEANKQAEIEARKSERQAILDRLGLTADEAKLLLG